MTATFTKARKQCEALGFALVSRHEVLELRPLDTYHSGAIYPTTINDAIMQAKLWRAGVLELEETT